jgi:ribosomal protein S6
MSEGKKHYEISFLAKSEAGKDDVMKALADIDAEITNEGRFSEMRLAYPVEKQTVAYFGFVYFMALAEKIPALHESLRFNEGILRSLIITPPPRKPIPRAERRSPDDTSSVQEVVGENKESSSVTSEDKPVIDREEIVPEEIADVTIPEQPAETKEEVNEELLDQKLDEILK